MPLAIYLGLERGLGVALALSFILVIASLLLLILLRWLEQPQRA
jgi:ABC-type sulfate transport system permease component